MANFLFQYLAFIHLSAPVCKCLSVFIIFVLLSPRCGVRGLQTAVIRFTLIAPSPSW